MARQVSRISDLPAAEPLEGDELLEMVQGGENVKVRVDELDGGGAVWGGITGAIEDQEDLVLFVDSKIGDIGLVLDGINGEVV